MKNMKRLLCLLIAWIVACSAAALASAAFAPSVFEGKDGFSCDESNGSWMYFRGIVFPGVDGAGVQLSVQAAGAGDGSAPAVHFFVNVTQSGQSSVSSFGTPEKLRLFVNKESWADLRLTDRYRNPACASAALGNEGEKLCRLLADTQSLSLEIAFENSGDTLSYTLTEENIEVFRRTIGNICGVLLPSGIFDAIRESGRTDDSGWISLETIPSLPEDTETPAPETLPEPTSVPTPVSTAVPTSVPTPVPTADPAVPDSEDAPVSQSFRQSGFDSPEFMGVYEQENDPAGSREPIEWQVLTVDAQSHRALLLSVYALDAVSFAEAANTDAYSASGLSWENSFVRGWLNNEFCQSAFSASEKERILDTELETRDKTGVHHTVDKVFLLDVKEVRQYLKKPLNMACMPTPYAQARLSDGSVSSEGYCSWMLRELVKVPVRDRRGNIRKETGNEVGYVNQEHGLKLFNQRVGCPVYRSDLCAVRPAVWVRLD